MLPSIAKEDLHHKIKEKQWDDRQLNKAAIPQYSPLSDKHTKSYRKIITHKKQDDNQTQIQHKPATYFQRRMELVDKLTFMHKANEKLIEQYEEIASKYKLPNFYIYYSLLPLLSPSFNVANYLFAEKKLLKEQSSHYHRILTAVKAREECLERIRKTLVGLTEATLQQRRQELKNEIAHLRLLNENAIDQIKKWRDHLGSIDERAVFYNETQQNYLIKMLNDNKFIFNSKLASALTFAEKNDPFLLVPLRKTEAKEASMFLSIVQLSKDLSHYQKYMEYLASQKAYELSLVAPEKKAPYKNPAVQKVYKAGPAKVQQGGVKDEEQQQGFKKMEVVKMREQRLKKNEERIKSIKSIYETYSRKVEQKHYKSEKKIPETDNEDKRGLLKKKTEKNIQPKHQSDAQFESMVKNKLLQDKPRTPLKKIRESSRDGDRKSASKSFKNEDKMIESLRDIQSTLRNKLQVLHKQQKQQIANPMLNSSQHKFSKKSNEEIIRQLKNQIMSKMQKESQEKDALKRQRREQEEKMLQEIKGKMRKEMEEKLEQKKRQKLLEREELQKKLKEEEERLNSQKQLQLQLQLKLNRQKQLRELQKIKKQALQRQRKYKQELQKQQKMRKEREEMIQIERKEKEQLIQELKKKEIKEQIQNQLKNQLKTTHHDRMRADDQIEQSYVRAQKHAELSKELQSLKMKEGLQLQQLRKENELRERMIRLKKDEEQLKRKQIQHLMKIAIQTQKQELQKEGVQKRIEIEENMRRNVKQKLLQEYRNEKQASVEKIKYEREKQFEQQIYRDKIREKIEKEMRMQAINRTKKQLDDRQNKKYEIKSKLSQVKHHFEKEVMLDKNKIEEEVKKEMVEKVIFDKQAQKEAAKYDLRQQFERQLMASSIPQLYNNKDSFLIKDINYVEGDLHLNSKISENRPTNQKPSPLKDDPSTYKSSVKQLVNTMTLEQLQVYEKQKEKVNQTKEQNIIPSSKTIEEQEGFLPITIDKSRRQDEGYEVKIVKQKEEAKKSQHEQEEKKRKKKKRKNNSSSQDSEELQKKKKKKKKNQKHYYDYYDESSEDSQELAKKKKRLKKARKQSSEEQPSSEESTAKKKQQKRGGTMREQEERREKLSVVKEAGKVKQQKGEKNVIHYDVDKSQFNHKAIEPITIKPQKASNNTQKFKMTLEAIPESQFDQYLEIHLSRVPQIQLSVQIHSRQELYRKLIGELTFCLLVGQHEGRVVGLAIAYHDRSRQDLRKFTIIHIATYQSQDLRDFILSTYNFILRKDPVDEIDFFYKFNQAQQAESDFSLEFNKWFDRYGTVYQKKMDESVFERKYVLKRQFNQKCEVVLGGVNKNTFRNIFSVYCGVLMSDTDMIQFKEDLVDTLVPENQICYSIMVSELFRTYLSPDEAEGLKSKVKEFVKLKEMLILVVMMQKKKLKLQELKLYEYKNLIELNMRLMSQGKEIIRYCKDTNSELNRLYYAELNNSFNLPFHFQTTSLPVEGKENQIRQISYFRLSPLPPFKLHIIKSSLYNAEMNILPTENSKYKIFVISAQEYNEIKEANNIDLFMYIRLFLKNTKSHNVAVWKYVWLPEMTDRGAWNLREYRSFLNKDFYTHDSINISYRQFLPGALIIQPQHRDLVITPPFIVGVLSMNLQQVSQGSPLYARMIELDALKTLEVEQLQTQKN